MEMQRDHVTRSVVVGQCDDRSAGARQRIENRGLSFYRHSLTQYRMLDA
jgi:hypothetical protein